MVSRNSQRNESNNSFPSEYSSCHWSWFGSDRFRWSISGST